MKLFLVLFFVLTNQAFAQMEYTLVCAFDGNQTVTTTPNPKDNSNINIQFTFKRGTKPATLGVDPGTCAWFDRAMNENEPNVAMHVTRNSFYWRELVYKGVPNLVYTPTFAYWASESRIPGTMMLFRVYQSRPDHGLPYPFFLITRW